MVQRVLDSTDIVELIGSYLPLKRAGTNYVALCPFHNEKTPSFTVTPQKQMFYCFGCQKGGGAFRFVMDYENTDFVTAVRKLADRAGVIIPEESADPQEAQRYSTRKRLLALHHEACEWFHRNLMRNKAAAGAREYLKNRGITGEIAKEWKLGFAPDSWNLFLNWARGQGYDQRILIESGLVKEKEPGGRVYDRFRNRVMFPIFSDFGEAIAFSGRTLEQDSDTAKYLNSPETPLFHKGSVFYGLHKSKRDIVDAGFAIVMEGQMDLIAAYTAGVRNVIAPQGTAFTEKQARVLRRFAEEAVLCFDADTAGQNAAEKSLPALLKHNVKVRVAVMPPGEDPDSLIRARGPEAFREIIQGAPEFFDQRLEAFLGSEEARDPRARVNFTRKMAGLALDIPEPMLRDPVLQKLRGRLELSEEDLQRIVQQQSREHQRNARYEKRHAAREREQAQERQPPEEPRRELLPVIRLLCHATLNDHAARQYLSTRKRLREILEATPDGDLVLKILDANLPEQSEGARMTEFLSRLPGQDQSLLTGIYQEKPPHNPETIARDCWVELRRRRLKQHEDALKTRLNAPDLEEQEMERIQKEILDLHVLLQDIARLSN